MKKPAFSKSPYWQESPLIEAEDIFRDLVEKSGPSLFLGKYPMNEVMSVLNKRNFLHDARKRNLWPLEFELDSSEFPIQRFQIFCKKKLPQNMIVDFKIREGMFEPKKELFPVDAPQEFRFLILEWLTLQNPLQSFSEERLPLPGQNYPGLGLGKKVFDVFVYLARLLKSDGLLAFPAYFHNALLFSRYFHFLNPEKYAEILAIREYTKDVPFRQLAWIVHYGCLKDKENRVYEWKAEELVYPLNKELKGYFDSKTYKKKVKEARKKFEFSVDWDYFSSKSRTGNLGA